jgi:class 3 adenylate cyclase
VSRSSKRTHRDLVENNKHLDRLASSAASIISNVVPPHVSFMMSKMEKYQELYELVTVIAIEMPGLNRSSAWLQEEFGIVFSSILDDLDRIASRYKISRWKCLGDAVVFVAGVPFDEECNGEAVNYDDPTVHCNAVNFALDCLRHVRRVSGSRLPDDVARCSRVGIASGSVLSAISGRGQWSWDLFGEPVSDALKLASSATDMCVYMAELTAIFARSDSAYDALLRPADGSGKSFVLSVDDLIEV